MEKTNLTLNYFHDDEAAREHLESIRWPNGPVCPHCGSTEKHYSLAGKETSRKPIREGVYKCKSCRKQFSVTVGTIFEKSHIPLSKWFLAIHLMCSSKKGMSAHQLHRNLGVTYKTAWFMAHRIRYAMAESPNSPFSGVVEADETYIGGKTIGKHGRGAGKAAVFALVERDGRVLSSHVDRVTAKNLKGIIKERVDKNSTIMTDSFQSYHGLGEVYARHGIINHEKKIYVRGDVHTNTVEGYFGNLKRGINGVYHHVSKHHLHRYLAEFDFRYNRRKIDDRNRTESAIINSKGKRLQYRESLSPKGNA